MLVRSRLIHSFLFALLALRPFELSASSAHDPEAKPDYDKVFSMDEIHNLTIHIQESTAKAMLEDMKDILGESGAKNSVDVTDINILSRDPKWFEVAFEYDGETWEHVGMRFKGNSSLASLWSEGNRKLPFKFNVNRYESAEVPEQKFHGFKKLTFAPNFRDNSQLREAYVNELLRSEGVPVAHLAFVRVFVERGQGREYWGLYSMIEELDDGAMLKREFGSKSGNLYKPESNWTQFDEDLFKKENNEDEADWSDIQGALAALMGQGPGKALWRSELEKKFDVRGFLKWLAINSLVLNWDSYGQVAHNYYLYADPAFDGRLSWIPWDHNFALQSREDSSLLTSLFYPEAGKKWPLISRLLADPIYNQLYRGFLKQTLEGRFAKEASEEQLRRWHNLISTSIGREDPKSTTIESKEAFANSLKELFEILEERRALAKTTLGL